MTIKRTFLREVLDWKKTKLNVRRQWRSFAILNEIAIIQYMHYTRCKHTVTVSHFIKLLSQHIQILFANRDRAKSELFRIKYFRKSVHGSSQHLFGAFRQHSDTYTLDKYNITDLDAISRISPLTHILYQYFFEIILIVYKKNSKKIKQHTTHKL